MNTVTFAVGLDRGRYIQQELEQFPGTKTNWQFEESVEEGIKWIRVTISNMSNLDALILFHAGFNAGWESKKFHPHN